MPNATARPTEARNAYEAAWASRRKLATDHPNAMANEAVRDPLRNHPDFRFLMLDLTLPAEQIAS